MDTAELQQELQKLNVLYVEDDAAVLDALVRPLERRVGRLRVARDGREGLELGLAQCPDILISDIRMPNMSGLEMARELRAAYPRLPIIVTSAFNDSEYLLEAIALRINQYVLKPVRLPDLLVALEACARELALERRLQEKNAEIRKLNTHLKLILDSAGEGIMGLDLEGRIMFVNRAGESMLGWSNGDLLGRSPHALVHHTRGDGRPYPVEDCPTYECMKTGAAAIRDDELYWRKDGSSFPVEYTCTPICNEQGALCGSVVVFKDITERKRSEEALARAKELAEVANRAKSEFLANMSHEIRTPLNSIMGFAQLLERDRGLNARQEEEAHLIRQAGEHLLTLINDILDLSKIEARKMELHSKPFHFEGFIKDIVDMCELRARQKGIRFAYRPLSPLPEAVQGDETRLRQVLINLLGNAIKFTERGSVDLEVEVLGGFPGGEHARRVRFCIRDTGIGIEAEHLDKIFLPFQQVHKPSYPAQGTGLGLSISQKFVEMMGGKLQVESQSGRGSRFWFELDLPEAVFREDMIKGAPHAYVTGFKGPGRKIMIVDDEAANRRLLVSLLQPLGFVLCEAENGQVCLDKALTCPPDLILLDLRMPVLDGFETVRRLRALQGGRRSLVIAASASVYLEHREQSLQAGCDDFLSKPINTAELLQKLGEHLKLEWIYETPPALPARSAPPADTALPLFPPPAENLAKVRELLLNGDIGGITDYAEQLARSDARFAPFAQRLKELAGTFELKKLSDFIAQCLDGRV